MTKPYSLSLHIFRRDLRLQDNTALIEALAQSDEVLPCFIFDKRQIETNDYKSDHCIQFMIHSLKELHEALANHDGKLYYFYGIAEEVVEQLIQQLPINAIYLNRDYTPFSRKRDAAIEKLCQKNQIAFHAFADALLHEPNEVLKADGTPYTIFTPFYKRAMQLTVAPPRRNLYRNFYKKTVRLENNHILDKLSRHFNPALVVKGGRLEALKLLKHIADLKNYDSIRNLPAINGTTHLSAHNKFGTISIREFYAVVANTFNRQHTLIAEMYWRDFFTHIGFHFPHVFKEAFHQKYTDLSWRNNQKQFRLWCEGRTGFPIVDAGMRELNTTGYMHNRVRMITASFLTKDLHIDWHWGEKYFAQKLVDYDPAVNNGNWQWAASTGCDAQPYFRIFNPWLQQLKFDPDCSYIKRFIPELSHIPNDIIHTLYKQKAQLMSNYPRPILDHQEASQQAKLMYQHFNQR